MFTPKFLKRKLDKYIGLKRTRQMVTDEELTSQHAIINSTWNKKTAF